MYQNLVRDFSLNPRDVHTVPTKGEPKWFYVFAEKGVLFVESGRGHSPKCTVKKRRLLEKEFDSMLDIYHRRQRGDQVHQEAHKYTYSQVYWYGIFAEMKL